MDDWLFPDIGKDVSVDDDVFDPRPYQEEADEAIFSSLQHSDKCGAYLATGTGKTEIAALLLQRDWGGGSLLITPRRELVTQSAERLRKRGVPCGVEMAEMRSDDPVTVACYASLMSKERYKRFLKTTKFIIVDESHMNFSTAALDMLAEFRSWGAKVCGMTASPPTKKGIDLTHHYGKPAFVYDYQKACDEGYLVNCKMHLCVLDGLDLSKFKASFGDFDQEKLNRLMKKRASVAGVGAMVEKYYDGKPSVVFCSSIEHAELVASDLRSRKIDTSIVHSNMDQQEVRMHMSDFMSGKSDVIVNVGILTLGWDAPHVQKLFIARCTASAQLYCQQFGRGTRIFPGDCIAKCKTAEERLAAIAASPKPVFEVYDITDSSRHNDLKCALDVLYPTLDDKLMDRVRRRTEKTTVSKPQIDQIIKEERAALVKEQRALEEAELRKRENIRVEANVRAFERDHLADAEPGNYGRGYTVMLWGKYKSTPFFRVPTGYIRWTLQNCKAPRKHPNYFLALRKELDRRKNG